VIHAALPNSGIDTAGPDIRWPAYCHRSGSQSPRLHCSDVQRVISSSSLKSSIGRSGSVQVDDLVEAAVPDVDELLQGLETFLRSPDPRTTVNRNIRLPLTADDEITFPFVLSGEAVGRSRAKASRGERCRTAPVQSGQTQSVPIRIKQGTFFLQNRRVGKAEKSESLPFPQVAAFGKCEPASEADPDRNCANIALLSTG